MGNALGIMYAKPGTPPRKGATPWPWLAVLKDHEDYKAFLVTQEKWESLEFSSQMEDKLLQ